VSSTGQPTVSWDEIKEQVRSRTDIVQLIGETVSLQPARGGRLFQCICPFHDDHNPSMQVNPERQTYRCWVCNEGGDCFSYVMKHDNLSFPEALALLAEKAGVDLPKRGGRDFGDEAGGVKKSDLFEVLNWATREFEQYLKGAAQAAQARDYIASRGLTPEIIQQFQLGYHPDDWHWLQERARGRYSVDSLAVVRLVGVRDNGPGHYDFFVDRLLFPICDERSRPVAFGGRVIPGRPVKEDAPKYWNSPESPLFSKSRLCYGLDQARDAIRKTETVVVTEGYMDCIKAHQHGLKNAVATLGTALTETHVQVLKRMARKFVLIYDGDTAGLNAAERSLPRFLAQDVDLRILTLPEGLDPDEYLEAHGLAGLEQAIGEAPEALEFKLRRTIERYGTSSVDARQRVTDELLETMAISPGLSGSVRERNLISRLTSRLGVSESILQKRLRELRGDKAFKTFSQPPRKVDPAETSLIDDESQLKEQINSLQRSTAGDDLLESEFFRLLLKSPDVFLWVGQRIGSDDLHHPALRHLWCVCLDVAELGAPPSFEMLLAQTESSALKGLIAWLGESHLSAAELLKLQQQSLAIPGWPEVAGQLAGDQAAAAAQILSSEALEERTLLAQLTERLVLRREMNHHKALRMQRGNTGAKLNPSAKDVLAQAMLLHRKRAGGTQNGSPEPSSGA
jgi:DNA primase